MAAAEKIGLPRGKEATRERKHGAQKQAVGTRQWRWTKEKSTIKVGKADSANKAECG